MTVIDVGAHVGYFALLAARLVGRRGRVVAIEPDALNFDLLCANVERSRMNWIEPIHAAAWAASGTVTLSRSETNTGDHRVGLSDEDRTRVDVRAIRVDDLISPSESVDVVVLDTQGSESMVVEGMRDVIRRCRPRMLVEFWPEGIRALGADPEQVIELYQELGYKLTVVGSAVTDRVAPARLTRLAERAEDGFCTLLLTPAPAAQR
jgi:FkbM family methyltransferase